MIRSGWILGAAVSLVALGTVRSAHAQDTGGTAGGSVGGSAGATAGTTATPAATTPPAAAATTTTTNTATAPAAKPHDDDDPDHEAVVGHFGVGYLGVSQLPIAAGAPSGGAGATGAVPRDNVNAPVIGVRYWLNRGLGLDLGVGFGITGGSTQTVNAGTERSQDSPSRLGLAFHGGVPLAFAHGKHYSFTVIPEATVGFTSGTIKVNGSPDIDLSGFRLDLGGRVGAEVYFGFIGIPQLSLQGSVGLFFRREAWKFKQGDSSASVGETTLATSVQSDPWALFVNNISAFYYF